MSSGHHPSLASSPDDRHSTSSQGFVPTTGPCYHASLSGCSAVVYYCLFTPRSSSDRAPLQEPQINYPSKAT
eukprot:918899-Pyramimonas_sp.AAC.1